MFSTHLVTLITCLHIATGWVLILAVAVALWPARKPAPPQLTPARWSRQP
jgi:hypothetical protein